MFLFLSFCDDTKGFKLEKRVSKDPKRSLWLSSREPVCRWERKPSGLYSGSQTEDTREPIWSWQKKKKKT